MAMATATSSGSQVRLQRGDVGVTRRTVAAAGRTGRAADRKGAASAPRQQRRGGRFRLMTQQGSSFASASVPFAATALAARTSSGAGRGVGGSRAPVSVVASFSTYGGRGGGSGGGVIPIPDRVVALLPYLVPLLDGLRYSRFFFAQFPQAIVLLQPIQPLASMYFSIPFAGMIAFFATYMGLAENKNMSRFVRFNAMQAIILDVCMVLPGMIEYVISPSSLTGAFFEVYKMSYNAVWLFVFAAFCLAAVGCASGKMYKLPYIGDAAETRI